ncbi:MAG: NAD(P)-binding domain-containing protein [Thermoanaerobaculia bacterium]|nr:NAD(P)-binding domain-containing protein [Thermoanaerobaculia bacterium]
MTPDVLIWSLSGTVALFIVGGYFLSFRRRDRADRLRIAEAQELGIHKPSMLFPYVDPSICIGCGGCVKACPEKDVLGLVGGLAVVVNGARCIGIGQCEKACPVGAIELAVGDLKGRADVPVMSENLETTVPGLYIAGELGGLALVRNAVDQGRRAVEAIAREIAAEPRPVHGSAPDLLIIGAGPAGLSAALAAHEHGLRFLVVEQQQDLGGTIYQYPRRKLTHTQPVLLPQYGPLKKDEYTKEELLEIFEEVVETYRLPIEYGQRVMAVESICDNPEEPPLLQVSTATKKFSARRVLLAMGRRGTPRKLGVPGEHLEKVLYQVRDAEQYRRLRILCVGGGDSAVEAAMGLARQPGNEVSLSYRREKIFRIKSKNSLALERLTSQGRITQYLPSQIVEIRPDSVILEHQGNVREIPNDFVFVMVGGELPFPLLRQAKVKFWDEVTGDPSAFLPRQPPSSRTSPEKPAPLANLN